MATSESEAHIESNLRTSTKATFTYQYIHQKLFNYKEVVEVVDRRDTDKRKVPKYARILKIGSSNFFFQTRPPFSQLTEQSIFFNEKKFISSQEMLKLWSNFRCNESSSSAGY